MSDPAHHLPTDSRLGSVRLLVTDVDLSTRFWTEYVGLSQLTSDGDEVSLGSQGEELIRLVPGATGPVVQRRTGLYHVAIHVPTQRELARIGARLNALRFGHAPTDHTSTMATYFSDPDGNGIEITFETPERGEMLILPDGRPVARLAATGEYRGVTEALDQQELYGALEQGDDLALPIQGQARIGHVHLHVRDLEENRLFYDNVIGFRTLLNMSAMGMADFALDDHTAPHSLAINSWAGSGAQPRPEGTAGLLNYTLLLPHEDAFDALKQRLEDANVSFEETDDGLDVQDPSGNELRVIVEA